MWRETQKTEQLIRLTDGGIRRSVSTNFLFLVDRHLLLEAMHLFLVAYCLYIWGALDIMRVHELLKECSRLYSTHIYIYRERERAREI